jgi:hypothetical protein
MHDPRVGRFFATDPLENKYPWYTPYQFSGNKVISKIELEGLEEASPKMIKDTRTNLINEANSKANTRTDEENSNMKESIQTFGQIQEWAGMMGKKITEYSVVRYAEGKGGYDIYDYEKAYNFWDFYNKNRDINAHYQYELKKLASGLNPGSYQFNLEYTTTRQQTGVGTFLADFSTSSGSFEIASKGSFSLVVGKNGSFTFTGKVYNTVKDNFKWHVGRFSLSELFPGLWDVNKDMNNLKQIGASEFGIRIYYMNSVSGNNNGVTNTTDYSNSYDISKHQSETEGRYYDLENGNKLIRDWRTKN